MLNQTFLGSFAVLPLDRFIPTGGLHCVFRFLARCDGSGCLNLAMKLLTAAAEQSEVSASSPSVSSESLTSRVEVSSLDFEVDAIDQSPF